MTKKRSGSSARDRRPRKSARHIADSKIDFSDIAELSDVQLLPQFARPSIDESALDSGALSLPDYARSILSTSWAINKLVDAMSLIGDTKLYGGAPTKS